MARIDDTLRQGDTDIMRFRHTAADTKGMFVEVEAEYDPMRDLRPPVHRHPRQDEHFEIVAGTMSFLVEGKLHEVGPDGTIDIPRNTFHTVWNDGSERARFIWRTTPALRTEDMYVTLWGLADEGRMGRHGAPRPPFLQSACLMFGYRNEYRLAKPPYPVMLSLCALLSPVARLLGYRPYYERYSPRPVIPRLSRLTRPRADLAATGLAGDACHNCPAVCSCWTGGHGCATPQASTRSTTRVCAR
jgi:mannose-6-phosphate isomerase-like protein (cupin superfamily)